MPATHFFTFGQSHMCNHPNLKGPLRDHYVTVIADNGHRDLFIGYFTSVYCPRPLQFAMEYKEGELNLELFPLGSLTTITEQGEQQ